MSDIELQGVSKRFGETLVLADVTLMIPSGSITAVLGPSGSGKTTLLRVIAGLERIDSGRISIGGTQVDDGRRTVRARDRRVGYVPQEGALFPHLTVAGNVGFGLARNDRGRIAELLELIGLGDLGRRYPHELSGGQQQRVALARALAIEPQVVLLDEPFGALDASLRTALRRDVARILTAAGTTTVLVTHDQDEALTLATHVAVLDSRRILAAADPHSLYRDPPSLAVAAAIGEANVIDGLAGDGHASCVLGDLEVHAREPLGDDGRCSLLVRPEQLLIDPTPGAGGVAASVLDVDYHGHDALVRLRLEGAHNGLLLLARTAGESALEPGDAVRVSVAGAVQAWASAPGGESPPAA